GEVILAPNKSRFLQVQLKEAYANPRALLDPRFRRAFMELTDRVALSEAIVNGRPAVADSIAGTNEEYSAAMDLAVTKYRFDPQDAARLLAEIGFTKRSDAPLVDAAGQALG